MKTPYTLSTDYALLFELIQDGTAIAGFVHGSVPITIFKSVGGNYHWKDKSFDFAFYESIDSDIEREKEIFQELSNAVNLRWIKP